MREFFKNFVSFCMNFRTFVTMSMNFVDLRMLALRKVYSNFFICDENSEKATHLLELRLKSDPYVENHPYMRHVQYHLTIKYPFPLGDPAKFKQT